MQIIVLNMLIRVILSLAILSGLSGILEFRKNHLPLRIAVSVAVSLLQYLFFNINIMILNVVTTFVIIVITTLLCFEGKKKTMLLYDIIVLICAFVAEDVATIGLAVFSDGTIESMLKNQDYDIPRYLISAILIFICINLVFTIIKKKYTEVRLYEVIIYLALAIGETLTSSYVMTSIQSSSSGTFMIFFLIGCLLLDIYIVLVFYRISRTKQTEQENILLRQQSDLLKKSLSEQETTFLSWKKNIHDYKNKMLALESMLKTERYETALEAIESEIDNFKDKAFYISTGNTTVDIILNNKMNIAKSQGIVFTFNVILKEELKITEIHLSSLLGNLIDNAFEAVQHEENKNVYVQISADSGKNLVKVINAFNGEFNPEKTSKADSDKHGIGLKSVKNIVSEYGGAFSIKHENGFVTALAVI